MTHAAQLGFKWRRIAGMLPNRSDDAVRNRFKRLEEARRHNDTTGVVATDTGEPPALLDENGNEDAPVSEPDFFVTLPQAGVHYNYALDSLYENDMLESVPVAPGEQSLYEQAVAAARALAASRARELSHKRKQRGSAPRAAIAVASWRRYR